MKKTLLVVCFAAQLGASPSFAAGTQPATGRRPIAAAVAAAGGSHGHLLSQTVPNRVSAQMSPGEKILMAGAIGFGAGLGWVYLSGDGSGRDKDKVALAVGTSVGLIAAAITFKLTVP